MSTTIVVVLGAALDPTKQIAYTLLQPNINLVSSYDNETTLTSIMQRCIGEKRNGTELFLPQLSRSCESQEF